jgi:hypothetical protein
MFKEKSKMRFNLAEDANGTWNKINLNANVPRKIKPQ